MNEGDAGNSNTVFYKQIDAAGNESGVSSYGFDYDATDPSVSGLTSPSGTDTDGDVTFTLTFSEPVDVSTVEETDLTIAGGTIGSVDPINEIAGAATSFTVTASGEGDVGSSLDLAVAVGASFADRAGNSITLTTEVTDTAAIDTVHPSVVSFGTTHTTGDQIKAGETVAITATMSETVQAGGQITVNLSSGGSAVLTADAEGTTLSGTYTVLASENADTLAVDTIVLNGSAPVDLAGNVMTDNTVPSADLGSAGIEVDTTAPANLSGMDVVYDNGVNSGGDDNLTNDPAVTTTLVGQGVDINEVAETSTTTYYALSDAGAGTSGWVTDPADLVDSMNEGDAGNSNTVFYKQIDAAGNESGVNYGFDYDATDPSVSGLTSPSGTDTDGDVTFTLTFSEPVDVSTVEETDLTIAGGTIGSVDPINEIAGAATSFTVTASGEGDVGSHWI